MKCNKCEKPATFHITERIGDKDQWEELHLCEECAREYLNRSQDDQQQDSLAGALVQQLKIGQTAEELAELDKQSCPICGITFYEFRQVGRLGCPHDYLCFEQQLEPLIANIHGDTVHTGKRPKRAGGDMDAQAQLIRLRRDMREAVQAEDYERASVIRDEIRKLEGFEV
jgi:protein arginine kinase activator